jgi:hypothetical protein
LPSSPLTVIFFGRTSELMTSTSSWKPGRPVRDRGQRASELKRTLACMKARERRTVEARGAHRERVVLVPSDGRGRRRERDRQRLLEGDQERRRRERLEHRKVALHAEQRSVLGDLVLRQPEELLGHGEGLGDEGSKFADLAGSLTADL